ncbi:hypothetical protein Tco_0611667 [Tanacetum coccineum]
MMKTTTTMKKNQVMKAVSSWNESDEQESDSEQEESEDDDQKEEEFVHTPTDDKDDDNLESESDDVIKSDKEKGMDDTTYQFDDDDIDARFKEATQTDKEVVQGEGADAEMNDAQQGNENLETTQEQVVKDAYVTISTVTKKTKVPIISSSHSDIPQDQERNPGDNDDEPRKEDASRRDSFKKPIPPQEPTIPDWHEGKTP